MQARIQFAVIYQSNEVSDSTASWFTSARLHKASLGMVAREEDDKSMSESLQSPRLQLQALSLHYWVVVFLFLLISAVHQNVITKVLIFPFNHL